MTISMNDIHAEAELDCVAAIFACPRKIVPIDGVGRKLIGCDLIVLEL